jgi:hypothetical protein
MVLCCLSVLPFISQLSSAVSILQVDEAGTRVLLEDERIEVSLPVLNPTGRSLPVSIRLEMLDPDGGIRATVLQDQSLKRGSNRLVIPVPLQISAQGKENRDKVLWYRLRYSVRPAASADPAGKAEGIISLSEITPDIFQLRITSPQYSRQGARYPAQVRALHPITLRAVKGVQVEGECRFEDGTRDVSLKASGVTDEEGYALLEFNLPPKVRDDALDLKVTAHHGQLVEEAESEIRLDAQARILISTDKPLYQPGQVLHLRTLMFDASRHALADTESSLNIRGPDGQVVFRAALKTSRFGIAGADWPIPDNTRLGDYTIRVEHEEESGEDSEAYATVKISRYELPNFSVKVKPDLPYYLPGQNAEVEVRGDYLFGQPVRRGHVRVVRERERSWNYREQKWDVKEEEKYEGETDEGGRFVAHINLQARHAELSREDYSRYEDLSYAAYFTDPTTNRTEQRRFDLRLTKSAIHVYVTETPQTAGFPLQFYLSTSYADGAPAECEVAISDASPEAGAAHGQTLKAVRTNRYGVAKVSGLLLPRHGEKQEGVTLALLARDDKGATGRQTNDFHYSAEPVIRLETDKTIYRRGESIKAELTASEPRMKVILDVWAAGNLRFSKTVALQDGRASLVLPYDAAFRDDVTIQAYSYLNHAPESRYEPEFTATSRNVLYPQERDLKLDVELDRASYRPGDETLAKFSVRGPDGRQVESALGVVVFDKAVEERARTDGEFSGGYGFYGAYRRLGGYTAELSGLSLGDLYALDLSKPLPEGVELAAEVMMRAGEGYTPNVFSSHGYSLDQRRIFARLIAAQVKPLGDALAAHYLKSTEYPRDEAGLRAMLAGAGLDFDAQRDPWMMPFRPAFSIEREMDVLEISSAGADKRFDTPDDFVATRMSWPYFAPVGLKLNLAAEQYHARTGGSIRDAATLDAELKRGGTDFHSLRDRWGRPYRPEFGIDRTNFTIIVRSSGTNGKFEAAQDGSSDDFTVWRTLTDYFAGDRSRLTASLAEHLNRTGLFPQNEKELGQALQKSGIRLELLRDPWGHDYYLTFSNNPRYAAAFTIQSYKSYQDEEKKRVEISPLTQPINLIEVHSPGPDGKRGTNDDFGVAALSRRELGLSAKGRESQAASTPGTLPGVTGAIKGRITDPNDAGVLGAVVTATDASSAMVYRTTCDAEGRYTLGNLPAGLYTVRVESPGFSTYVVDKVPVRSSSVTRVNAMLNVGTVSAMVEVTSSAGGPVSASGLVDATVIRNLPLSARSVLSVQALQPGVAGTQAQISTPRLREYFPETLVWQPSLETDPQGRAELRFKLADNITTWKMSVIGSTVDGEVGTVEKEIRAFQPFFVEHDPPRVLTEGDEIQLPVVLRNYLDKQQTVKLDIKPEDWFMLTGPAQRSADVPAGEAARETFNFRAVASVREGKQRITATGTEASDAIEKPVSVHPDGQELARTASGLLGDSAALDINIPEDAIRGSLRAELKIYPNVMTHVAESIEGILQRPYGCGEQTISSTYPNLMLLRYGKSTGREPRAAATASRYLRAGYERLLNYRAASGGFTYWGGREEANLALTAYALRFLMDARGFLEVDEEVIDGARGWLVKQQRADGGWGAAARTAADAEAVEDAALTALTAHTLARTQALDAKAGAARAAAKDSGAATAQALKRALAFLSARLERIKDPYALAAYALAALDAGEKEGTARALAKLGRLAEKSGGATYWEPQTSTPFHGWGEAGRLETTGLVMQALARSSEAGAAGDAGQTGVLVSGGFLYLVQHKDRYGVWQSTQATVNVLDALMLLNSKQGLNGRGRDSALAGGAGQEAELFVNGRPAATVTLPAADALDNPLTIDVTRFLSVGGNRVEIRRAAAASLATAQLVSTYYVPWPAAAAETVRPGEGAAGALRLKIGFSRSEAAINSEITCRVEAGRSGYGGMLLAEIGLPPGAEVDRASLEEAVKNSGWALSRYDVLPDRVVVYLWPIGKVTRFDFKFRPRFGLTAKTAPSLIYDYYNPEASMVVAPAKFVVR